MSFPFISEDKAAGEIAFLDTISDQFSRKLPPVKNTVRAIIIIPAKDEEDGIEFTLKAIQSQKDFPDQIIPFEFYEVLVMCHNCSDRTFEKCRKFRLDHPGFPLQILELNSIEANTVGAARRILMNIAAERLPENSGLIISTDADTIPDSLWLNHLFEYINKDIDMICGLINPTVSPENHQADTYLKAKDAYMTLRTKLECQFVPISYDSWPRHSYHWGPNLAVKKEVYQKIGGMKPLHFLGDVDFYKRVILAGYKVRHSLKAIVNTSTRINSRCTEGFGAELKVWTEWQGVGYEVEGLEKLISRFEMYQKIAQNFHSPSFETVKELMELSGVELKSIEGCFKESPNFRAAIISFEDHLDRNLFWNEKFPNTGVLKACQDLEEYFSVSPFISAKDSECKTDA